MAFFWKKKKSESELETLDKGLQKTKTGIFEKIARAVAGKTRVDDEVLDGIEDALIATDVGVDTTLKIIDMLEERVARDKYMNIDELHSILKEEMTSLLNISPDGADEDGDANVFDFSAFQKDRSRVR